MTAAESWRDIYPVHPAADLFPMMSEDELDELAKDITANGLRQPLVQWRGPDGVMLIDGRNRLEAIERTGLLPTMKNQTGAHPANRRWPLPVMEHGDPVAAVMSLNVHRRHLSREQKREAVAALLKLTPERSDRQVAKDIGVSPTTVGAVRQASVQSGQLADQPSRVGADGKTRMHVVREPYAIEAERAAIAEADLTERQRGIGSADKKRIETLIGTCAAWEKALPMLKVDLAASQATDEEIQSWRTAVNAARHALAQFEKRIPAHERHEESTA